MMNTKDELKKNELEALRVKTLIAKKTQKRNKKQSNLEKYLAKIDDSIFMKIIKASLWGGGIALLLSKALEVFLGKSIANEDMLNRIEIITVFGIAAVLLVAWVLLDVMSEQQCDQENENPSSNLSNVTSCDKEVQTDDCLAVS